MELLLINITTFAGVFLAVVATNLLMVDLHAREKKRAEKRLEEQYRRRERERAKRSPLLDDFSAIAAEARVEGQKQRSFRQKLKKFRFLIDQSGVSITLTQITILSVGLGVLGGLVGWILVADNWMAAALAGALGTASPSMYIYFKRRQRLAKLRTQLPDAFDLMGRVLRSGQTISQAMQSVGEEFSRPISLEFLYCSEQMNLGLSQEAALNELARRTGMLEMKIFVLAVLVHRQTGGNLAQLLDNLAHLVRERFRIEGMINSLTAQGRLQAIILLCLPPAMFVVLMIISPTYEILLLEYPSVIMVALGMMAFGWMWIQKIINFDF